MSKDFLQTVTVKKVKKEIRNICDSYSNPWDIFAELAQNSIDAIKKWENLYSNSLLNDNKKHKIIITIDRHNRSIVIEDTGVGFNPSTASSFLAPNNGDKDEDDSLIGEKGVGLTFTIFSSNGFKLETKSVEGDYFAEIKNAKVWRDNNDFSSNSVPQILNEKSSTAKNDPNTTYTKIELEDLESNYENTDMDFFRMSKERILFYLRTKTAIGSTKKRFQNIDLNIDIILNIRNNNIIEEKEILIKPEYLFLDEYFKKDDIVDLIEYEKIAGRLSDLKKRKHLQNKCLKMEGNEGKYRYFCFFVYSTDVWSRISNEYKLYIEHDGEIINDITHFLTVSTKGMPTGFEVPPPVSGAAGYWNNMYAIIEYDNICFDLGRKYPESV